MEKKMFFVAKDNFKYAEACLSEHHLYIQRLSYIYIFSREKGRRARIVTSLPLFCLVEVDVLCTFICIQQDCYYMAENSFFVTQKKLKVKGVNIEFIGSL